MGKIIQKINEHAAKPGKPLPFFSFEFFPPKTIAGVENLYTRMERMATLNPMFIDITWGAGGVTEELSTTIADYAQKFLGVDVLLHLTCTNLTKDLLKRILENAKSLGIRNILAVRGDPPKGALKWTPIHGGCQNAKELVEFIREEFGDHFGIAVAGFPEGHPDNRKGDYDEYIFHLKEKVEAGADFIMTQFFYDAEKFLNFLKKCREAGITCPIIPGIMPIHSYSFFQKMTKFAGTCVPDSIWTDLAPLRDDDEAVKAYGINMCVRMIQGLQENPDVLGFHFYTLNLEKSVMNILQQIKLAQRSMPWRGSRCDLKGMAEEVRPINWCNRPKSYIQRTVTWDEFPNGRWGDGRSPAFGELSDLHFLRPNGNYSREDYLAMWGESPVEEREVYEVFANYIEGKIPLLPWCETDLQAETSSISENLAILNRNGFLTINSQPAVNGIKSSHKVYGWGGTGGYCYQKAYVEFFVSPENLKYFKENISKYPNLNLHAVNADGEMHCNGYEKDVIALTWGVFPNREILQPTIFDPESFIVWSKEAFLLWKEGWASLYDDETRSSELLHNIHDTYYLVAIIDNDYIESDLYSIFKDVINARSEDEQIAYTNSMNDANSEKKVDF